MTIIQDCLKKKTTKEKPIWLMRQAGRYLPEFRKIRKLNPNFIKLCLNNKLSTQITLQPLKRFELDAAIVFSDILMVPYALNQEIEFKKNFGPKLGSLSLNTLSNIKKKDFLQKLNPIYKTINKVKKNNLTKNKDVIGFVGAPWTLLVYMINKHSPKKKLIKDFFKDKILLNEIMFILDKFIKIHIDQQIKSGSTIIQIFDSWAGLLNKKDLFNYVYNPTLKLVNYVKSLRTPVVCFPRGIENYIDYTNFIKPDVISIDYEVDPKYILKNIKIPVQGGLNPKFLLSSKENLKKEALKYLDLFKDHPYIFNLGHGVMPQTKPDMIDYLVKLVKDY